MALIDIDSFYDGVFLPQDILLNIKIVGILICYGRISSLGSKIDNLLFIAIHTQLHGVQRHKNIKCQLCSCKLKTRFYKANHALIFAQFG